MRNIAEHANSAIIAGDMSSALAALRALCCAMPENSGIARRLTALLANNDEITGGTDWARRCLVLGGPFGDDMRPVAQMLVAGGRSWEAEPIFRRLLRGAPSDPDLWAQRGLSGEDWRPVLETLRSYVRSLCLDPNLADASARVALLLQANGRPLDGEKWSHRSVILAPDDAKRASDNAHLLLRQDPTEARSWRAYRTRWRALPGADVDLPAWDGSARDGQRLLVWGEQGIGDQVMMSGFLAAGSLTGGGHCLLVNPRLVGLMKRSFPDWVVAGSMPDAWLSGCTHQIPIGDLGAVLSRPPYRVRLAADTSKTAEFQGKYSSVGKPLVGISWSAGARPDDVVRRSLPRPALDTLIGNSDVRFVSLQYGASDRDLALLEEQGVIIDRDVDPFGDMDTVAAQIAALDAVITVGNTVAHVAGAVGAPRYVYCPRWRAGAGASRLWNAHGIRA